MPIVFAPLKILDEVASDIYSSLKKAANNTKESIYKSLEVGFTDYIEHKYKRYSKIHTLLSPHEPIDVEEIYVHPTLENRSDLVFGENILHFILQRQVTVVQAIAGYGKSMLLRELFCRLSTINHSIIPVFIELRNIDFNKSGVIEAAYQEVFPKNENFSKSYFEKIIDSGKIIFLLDGFDEIKIADREIALKSIDQIAKNYPNSKIVMTSRPSDIFNGWNVSTILSIKEYDLPQIISLIEKSPIDSEIKDAFRERVESDYIKSHVKFLANPLLCNMMILTFMRGGEIPDQKHIFYKKAFETLYRHHDDMKFLYKRDFHSNLAEDVFVRLWSCFCYFSYREREISFDLDRLHNFINIAIDYISVKIDQKAIARDFIESLCIIIKDGESYSFLHRSFQEYGAAVFLCNERIDRIYDPLDSLKDNLNDDVMDLVLSIRKDLIEHAFVLPRIDNFIRKYNKLRSEKKRTLMFYSSISIDHDLENPNPSYYYTLSEGDSSFSFFIRRNYRKWPTSSISDRISSWLRKIRNETTGKTAGPYRIDFNEIENSVLQASPITDLIEDYIRTFNEIRDDIISRQIHQTKMLRST